MLTNAGKDITNVIISLLIPRAALIARSILKTRKTRTILTKLGEGVFLNGQFFSVKIKNINSTYISENSSTDPITETTTIKKSNTFMASMKYRGYIKN